jgi:chromosome partitioning protein
MDPKMTSADAAEFMGITRQGLQKKIKQNDLDHKKSQNRVYFGYETARKIFNIQFKTKVIAIQIVKGGSGKTAIAHAIGVRANLYGARVLYIDLDQQANLTEHFGIDSEELPVMLDVIKGKAKIKESIIEITPGLHIFPSKIDNAILDDTILFNNLALDRVYKDPIDSIKDHYDLIIIDCPPALGRSVGAAALAADQVLAPVSPDKQCLRGLSMLYKHLKELALMPYGKIVPLKIIYNKFDSRTNLSKKMLTALIEHPIFKNILFDTYVRQNQEFANAYANICSIYDTLKTSSAKEDVDLLTKEILNLNQKIIQEDKNISKVLFVDV